MPELKNETNGPRAIHTNKGEVLLQPGETLGDQYEVDEANLAAIESTGFLKPSGGSRIEPANPSTFAASLQEMAMGTTTPPVDTVDSLVKGNSKAQLQEIANTEGVTVEDGASKDEIAQAIIDKRNA
jgi:hypothetical protein